MPILVTLMAFWPEDVMGENEVSLETDPRFPSGKWHGFFIQKIPPIGKQWMEMEIQFVNGMIHAMGRDVIGKFFFKGKYDLDTGKCYWTKLYTGKHEVFYQGYQEGKSIWGTWEINESYFGVALKGGFKIWPGTSGSSPEEVLSEEAEMELAVPAMAPR